MRLANRPLTPLLVNLSLSESTDSEAMGFPASEMNRTLLRLVATFLGQGARLVFGHDWRDDGVMESVFTYVERYRPTTIDLRDKPLLINLLAWPDKTRLTSEERRRLQPTLRVETRRVPASLRARAREHKAYYPAIRALALTDLRVRLTEISDARICLGGRMQDYQGRCPGIVEEALLSIRAQKPLYLIGFLGGATRVVIDALQGNKNSKVLIPAPPPQDLEVLRWLRTLPLPYSGYDALSSEEVWESFSQFGVHGLSRVNNLSPSENKRLFDVETVDEAIELILLGIHRTWKRRGRS